MSHAPGLPAPTPPPARGTGMQAHWERRIESWLASYPTVIAYAVLALGFAVRLWKASGTFLNPDEAQHFLLANQPSLAAAYAASLHTAHPPLLILFLELWERLGTSELVLRMPSVIAGTIFCWLLFRWITNLLGQAAGWVGLVLACFLPAPIELSAEVRQYSMLLCFATAAVCLFERAEAENSSSKMLLAFFFLYLAMFTHYSGLLFAGALALYSLLRMASRQVSLGVIAAWIAGQAGTIALFLFLYRTHISHLRGSDVEKQTMELLLRSSYFNWGQDHLPLFIFARTFGVFQFTFGQLAVGDVAAIVFIMGVIILLREKRQPDQPSPRATATFLLLPFALNCATGIMDLYPYGGTRHSAFLVPFAIAGVSLGAAKLLGQRNGQGILVALLTVAVCHWFGVPHRPYMLRREQSKANMIRAIDAIRQQVPREQVIFVDLQTNLLLRRYLCPDAASDMTMSVPNLRTFECDGYRVISARGDIFNFSASTFLSRWNEVVAGAGLKAGDKAVVFQAGWDPDLARQLQKEFPEFRSLAVESFGRNIRLFELAVGHAMPMAR